MQKQNEITASIAARTSLRRPLAVVPLCLAGLMFLGSALSCRPKSADAPAPVPMAPPLGFVPTPPLWETIRAMVQREMSQQAAAADAETFEEADDFEVGDDYDPTSPFEEVFEPDQPWPPSRQVENAEQDAAAAAEDVARLRRELAEAEKRAGGPRPPDNVAPPQGARPEDANPGA